jgi:hypothetical protein
MEVVPVKSTPPQSFVFEILHDYEIKWITDDGTQNIPRISRMGYISECNGVILFDARGPDRRIDGEFAGTKALDRRWLMDIKEVPRTLDLRYAGRLT